MMPSVFIPISLCFYSMSFMMNTGPGQGEFVQGFEGWDAFQKEMVVFTNRAGVYGLHNLDDLHENSH